MAEKTKGKSRKKKTSASGKSLGTTHKKKASKGSPPDGFHKEEASLVKLLALLTGEVAGSTLRLMAKTGGASYKIGKSLIQKPEQIKMMQEAGTYLKDLREVAGLTISDLGDAVDLKDHSLLAAVEKGTAILSFELIVRLASLLARHDPIPFIIRFTRSYNPEVWKSLEDWGVGKLPAYFERERLFINIYRSHDEARSLTDDGFSKVLEFTQAAFEMALHFIAHQERPKKTSTKKHKTTQK